MKAEDEPPLILPPSSLIPGFWDGLTPHRPTDTRAFMPGDESRGSPTPLDALRAQIDAIDEKLVALLNERARVVVEVGKFKQQNNSPIYAPDREKTVLQKVRK